MTLTSHIQSICHPHGFCLQTAFRVGPLLIPGLSPESTLRPHLTNLAAPSVFPDSRVSADDPAE